LLYGRETWTVKARGARRITAAEMTYMRRKAGCTWTDYKKMHKFAKELENNTNFWKNYCNTREVGYNM